MKLFEIAKQTYRYRGADKIIDMLTKKMIESIEDQRAMGADDEDLGLEDDYGWYEYFASFVMKELTQSHHKEVVKRVRSHFSE